MSESPNLIHPKSHVPDFVTGQEKKSGINIWANYIPNKQKVRNSVRYLHNELFKNL